MVEKNIYMLLIGLNYLQFIACRFSKKYFSLKERILLTTSLILPMCFVALLPQNFIDGVSILLIYQIYLLIKKGYSWLLPAIISSIETTFIIGTWLLTTDLLAILHFKNLISDDLYFNNYWFVPVLLLQQIILFISIIFLNYINIKYKLFELVSLFNKKYKIPSIIIFIFNFICIYLKKTFIQEQYLSLYYLLSILIFVFSTLLLISCYYLSKYFREKEYTSILSNAFKREKILFDTAEEFRHDYKNILISLTDYLESGNIKQALDLLQEITSYSKDLLQPNLVQSILLVEIPPVQGLLNNFIDECLEKNIKLDFHVLNRITDLNMQVVDFLRCLSILLNNALEAAELTPDPYILICFSKNDNETIIEISNSCLDMNPLTYRSLFNRTFTTKKKHRGLGLSIFSKITNQYKNIHYVFSNDQNKFSVTLYITNKTPMSKLETLH